MYVHSRHSPLHIPPPTIQQKPYGPVDYMDLSI